jgi:hypothetical protein
LRPAGFGGGADPGGKSPKKDAFPIAVIAHEKVIRPLRAHKRPSPIGIRRRKAAVQILIPESDAQLRSVSTANSDLTSQQLDLARFNSFPPFVAPIFLSLSFCPLFLSFALLLVCEACPVSVSVRPERLSVSGVSRDPGHHSRFVPFVLLLATAARGIGVDGASCGKSIHRVSH